MLRLVGLTRAHFDEVCADFGLSPPQGHVLYALAPGRSVAMGELAGHMRCDASNITGLVDRLEAKGLVERRASASDRRVKTLAVTPEGTEVREKLAARLGEGPPSVAALEEEDREALRKVVRKVVGEA